MAFGDPKKHHFVPRMLLRRFADSEERFFHYTRHRQEICQVHISTVFCRNHLYAMPPVEGERDVTLEKRFAEIEDVMSTLFDLLVPAVMEEKYPRLRDAEREALGLFLYQQWRRVPDFHEEVMGMAGCVAAIREAISQFEADIRPITAEERTRFLSSEATKRFQQSARVRSFASASRATVQTLLEKGLFFGLAPARKSFIIASHPVLKVIPHGAPNALSDPMVEAWLPIHPRIVMAFAGTPAQQGIVQIPEREVRRYNLAVARRSTEFASTSRDLVESVRRSSGPTSS